ncbi:MAG: NAD-dependent epimerase/dehydratase family protein [Candidatus Levyibacteriota bacterium]|nr:MAG: NAD-dependent epimerase/dehydratase family protein [Candidatus Levybacteria bacterium]
MKNNFLLTGATGFIGSNLARELVRQEQNVSVIVRNKELNWRLKDIADKLDIYECNIQDEKLLEIVNRVKPDYIFHLARYGNLPQEEDILKMIDINFKGTVNLINAAKQNPFKLLINTSSCIEYGVKEQSMKETDYLVPINNFGVVAAGITLYAQKEAIRNNLPIITLRLFTPYGYYEDGFRLIPSVIKSAIENELIKVSTPENVRDFIFIEDVVDAYIGATGIRHNPGEIYNIGSGRQHSIGDIVRLILEITKSKSNVQWGAVKKQTRYIEPAKWQANISKTKKILRWEPKNSIEFGLQKAIQWLNLHKDLYNN